MNLDEVYGDSLERKEMNVTTGEGSLEEIANFAGEPH